MAWFPCNIGGGSPEPTPVPISMKVKTTSVSGYTASVKLSTYYDAQDVVYSTVMGESNAVVFGAVKLYYDNAWYLKAFTTCEYDGNTYDEGDLINTWSYSVNVDMRIDYTEPAKGNATMKQGTFVSASSQYGIVDVNCGFEPDMVMVRLPFGNNDTTSYWEKGMSWAETTAFWNLKPAENVVYEVALNRQSGETGIQAINNNGFSFMSNGGNTQGITCEYIAVKYEVAQPDKMYLFKDGEWENQDILSLYGYKTSVENGSLKCTGTHAGIVVDDVSGLDVGVTKYNVYLKVRAGNVNSYALQTGRNVPTQNLYDIIHYGTDRYSYNTDYISSGTDYLFVLMALFNTDGIFLGTENYTDDNAYYYIDEIWLEETPTQVIVHS